LIAHVLDGSPRLTKRWLADTCVSDPAG
jgi:hypothetical protein